MNSSDLRPSPLWQKYAQDIERDLAAGMPFDTIHTMNIVIKQNDPLPYIRHRERLDEVLWYDDHERKTIIEVGAGYGAMAPNWPTGSKVFNVDLDVMLRVQEGYVDGLFPYSLEGGRPDMPAASITFIPIDEADTLPWDGAYLFSVWALTETTMPTWEYYIDKAPQLAGAYILGFKQWTDEDKPWPWDRMAAQFKCVRKYRDVHPGSVEFCGVNR